MNSRDDLPQGYLMNRRTFVSMAINPDLERFMAKRMGAKTIEVKASHLSLAARQHDSLI
jgi:hypothetical protein